MRQKLHRIEPEVAEAIDDVIRARMGRWGFTHASVRADFDSTGEEALFIEAHYDLRVEPLEAGVTSGLVSEIRRAIEEQGEDRFPFIRHRFHELQTTTSD